MMTDLRDKVTGLLDDSSLDGVKVLKSLVFFIFNMIDTVHDSYFHIYLFSLQLTHYATILHLMEAPRDRVVEKLLHAHQSRAQRVILDFVASTARPAGSSTTPSGSAIVSALPSVTRTTAVSVVSAAASPSSPSGEKRVQPSTNDLLEAVSNVRKFHHTIVAGLVEACNGFNEVFAPVEELTSPNGRGGSQSAFTPRSDTDEKVPENASTSPEDDVKKEEIVQQELEARCKAYTQLKHTLDQIAPQYQDHFVNSIQSFFTQLNEHIQYCQELEDEYLKNPDQPIGVVGPLSKVSTNPFADDDTGGSIYDEPTTSVSQAELHKKIISAGMKLYDSFFSATIVFIFLLVVLLYCFIHYS